MFQVSGLLSWPIKGLNLFWIRLWTRWPQVEEKKQLKGWLDSIIDEVACRLSMILFDEALFEVFKGVMLKNKNYLVKKRRKEQNLCVLKEGSYGSSINYTS